MWQTGTDAENGLPRSVAPSQRHHLRRREKSFYRAGAHRHADYCGGAARVRAAKRRGSFGNPIMLRQGAGAKNTSVVRSAVSSGTAENVLVVVASAWCRLERMPSRRNDQPAKTCRCQPLAHHVRIARRASRRYCSAPSPLAPKLETLYGRSLSSPSATRHPFGCIPARSREPIICDREDGDGEEISFRGTP